MSWPGSACVCINSSCPCHPPSSDKQRAAESEWCKRKGLADTPDNRMLAFVSAEEWTPILPSEAWEREFEETFFYRGDGMWGYWSRAFNENDEEMDRVRAYMVPEVIKSFISRLLTTERAKAEYRMETTEWKERSRIMKLAEGMKKNHFVFECGGLRPDFEGYCENLEKCPNAAPERNYNSALTDLINQLKGGA